MQFLLNLRNGFILSALSLLSTISYVVLIFAGDLTPYLSQGISAALVGLIALSFIIPKLSNLPEAIAQPQHVVCALLSYIISSISLDLKAKELSQEIFPTIFIVIAVSSLLMGFFFLAIGYFKWGRLVRFIPYPVIGGVLAGAGWIIVMRALTILTGDTISWHNISHLFDKQSIIQIVPALIVTLIYFTHTKFKERQAILMPTLVIMLLIYYVGMSLIFPSTIDGWFIGPIKSGSLMPHFNSMDFHLVNWKAIFSQIDGFLVLFFTVLLAFLFTTTGLEVISQKDINLDDELKGTGVANIVAGFGGGIGGYQSLNLSLLNLELGTKGGFVGVFTALLAFVGLFLDASWINYFPKAILGGSILYFGLNFLVDWAYSARYKLPVLDYLLVLTILIATALVGFVPGVILGIIIGMLIFIIKYSQTNVVKYAISGDSFHSNVDRPFYQQEALERDAGQIYILKLHGFIFFGTAFSLLTYIKRRLEDKSLPRIKYLLLDFRLVSGIDSSVVYAFIKLGRLTDENSIVLILTELKPEILELLKLGGFDVKGSSLHRIFNNLDYGVEWCEEQILASAKAAKMEDLIPQAISEMKQFIKKITYPKGSHVIKQGDRSDEIYFIESGKISAQLELPDGRLIRLRSMGAGTFVGEIGFYLNTPRVTSVITEEPTTCYVLTKNNLQDLMLEKPELVLAFHEYVAKILAERLRNANKTVEALL